MENENWKKIGKIFASIALSVLIAFFWISHFEKSSISKPKSSVEVSQGAVLENFLDKPYTLVSFWATWCLNCEESLKTLNSLKTLYPEEFADFDFITINLDEQRTPAEIKTYWSSLDLKNLSLNFDPDKSLSKSLNVSVLPTYFLVSEAGDLLLRLEGQIRWQDKKVLKLLWSY